MAKKCEMGQGTIGQCPYENLTKGPYCRNCSANLNSWGKRPTSDLLKYQQKLSLRSQRMAEVGSPVKKTSKRKAK